MSIFNKRNALVGFLALKALERRRRRRRRSALKLGAFLALGVISFGVLAGLAAVLVRRQQGGSRRLEGYAVGDGGETESDTVGEQAATPEPIPAT